MAMSFGRAMVWKVAPHFRPTAPLWRVLLVKGSVAAVLAGIAWQQASLTSRGLPPVMPASIAVTAGLLGVCVAFAADQVDEFRKRKGRRGDDI